MFLTKRNTVRLFSVDHCAWEIIPIVVETALQARVWEDLEKRNKNEAFKREKLTSSRFKLTLINQIYCAFIGHTWKVWLYIETHSEPSRLKHGKNSASLNLWPFLLLVLRILVLKGQVWRALILSFTGPELGIQCCRESWSGHKIRAVRISLAARMYSSCVLSMECIKLPHTLEASTCSLVQCSLTHCNEISYRSRDIYSEHLLFNVGPVQPLLCPSQNCMLVQNRTTLQLEQLFPGEWRQLRPRNVALLTSSRVIRGVKSFRGLEVTYPRNSIPGSVR